ncbi:hypothetical protein XENOCAPTIV_026864 [Xenoophorus captivus]|uniref:Uncharacterized protein n=1 Tax=Xenoophorus captivus TaxID=1517983 RepID=A0ABV0QEP4_9TELE
MESLVTEATLARLVKEGVSGVRSATRDLLPHTVLALDVAAAQMAPLHASFVTLDPGHMGDLGQSPSLGSCSTAHPDRLLLESKDKLLGETYTDMLGCSMSRSSMGLVSAVAPSAVKQGGGVTNQLSSMQPLSESDLLAPPLPPQSLPEPGDIDGVEEGVDSLARLGRLTGVVATKCGGLLLGQDRGSDGIAGPRV